MKYDAWIKTEDRLPEQNQQCIILARNVVAYVGPIPYMLDKDGKGGMWIDLFSGATDEGSAYGPDSVGWWLPADALPDLPTK